MSKRKGCNTLQPPFAGYHVLASLGRFAYALVSPSGRRIKEEDWNETSNLHIDNPYKGLKVLPIASALGLHSMTRKIWINNKLVINRNIDEGIFKILCKKIQVHSSFAGGANQNPSLLQK